MSRRGSDMDRKTTEKNRRNQMKSLCFKLVSTIPPQHLTHPKEFLSQQDQLEQGTDYIQKLSARLEELRRRKEEAELGISSGNDCTRKIEDPSTNTRLESSLPVLRVRDLGSSLEVVLISGLSKKFMVHQLITVVEEEGAEVVNVTISNDGDKIFHTLLAKAKVARIGVDLPRICGRLEDLIS